MVALADDDGVKSFADKFRQRAMGGVDERTSCFEHAQAVFARCILPAFRCAVRGDHHGGRGDGGGFVLKRDAA